MPDVLMKCGHRANATTPAFNASNDQVAFPPKPCCAICAPRPEAYEIDTSPPSLEGRTAKCDSCSNTQPSSLSLPFFEYRGPLSRFDSDAPSHNVARSTHVPGGFLRDSYYCGCRGWD